MQKIIKLTYHALSIRAHRQTDRQTDKQINQNQCKASFEKVKIIGKINILIISCYNFTKSNKYMYVHVCTLIIYQKHVCAYGMSL